MYTGELLKKIRLLKGLNQSGIAKMIGITQQAYSKTEKHEEIEEQKFIQIIKAIGCSDKELEIVKNYPLTEK
jgi:transcriptional regulator with XRE-family HTH domain